LYPGAAVFLLGLAATITLFVEDVAVRGVIFAERTMVLTAALINLGFEAILFWVFAKVIAIQRGLLKRDVSFERFRRAMPLERGLALGAVLIVLGMSAFIVAISEWSAVGFGELTQGVAMRMVIVSGTTLVLGAQILYGSFFLYVLDYRAAPRQQEVARQD